MVTKYIVYYRNYVTIIITTIKYNKKVSKKFQKVSKKFQKVSKKVSKIT